MTIVVSLHDIVGEMDIMNDEIHAYLNKVTGELVEITNEEMGAIENDEDWSNFPEWQQESLAAAKKVLETTDYIPLPSKFDIHEYDIMERFCFSIEDETLSDELLDQIHGSGAFRRFKNAIHRHDIEEEWYRFKNHALEEIAIDWLESEGIAYTKTETAG